jgi:hypothetical protein
VAAAVHGARALVEDLAPWRCGRYALVEDLVLGDAAGTVADVRLDPVESELFSALRRLSYIMRYSLKIYSPDQKISVDNFILI